eukprot:1151678-Pelagomonas_calceolata.AAC.2
MEGVTERLPVSSMDSQYSMEGAPNAMPVGQYGTKHHRAHTLAVSGVPLKLRSTHVGLKRHDKKA